MHALCTIQMHWKEFHRFIMLRKSSASIHDVLLWPVSQNKDLFLLPKNISCRSHIKSLSSGKQLNIILNVSSEYNIPEDQPKPSSHIIMRYWLHKNETLLFIIISNPRAIIMVSTSTAKHCTFIYHFKLCLALYRRAAHWFPSSF